MISIHHLRVVNMFVLSLLVTDSSDKLYTSLQSLCFVQVILRIILNNVIGWYTVYSR